MEEHSPRVTVFMAAYNASEHIKEAINSILNQTYANFELLIVNDGSTDTTAEIVAAFSDNRIRTIDNGDNKGLIYTRNIALLEAKGELLAIMDSDDIASRDRLALQVAAFDNNPALALYGGQAKVIDEKNNVVGAIQETETNPDLLKIRLLFHNTFVHSSVMMRTAVFREMGGYQEPFAEDYDLFLRISNKYHVANSSSLLVSYRMHGQNVSNKKGVEIINRLLPIKGKLLTSMGLPADSDYQKIMALPYIWQEVSVEKYKDLYAKILNQNKRITRFNEALLEEYMFNKWYDVVFQLGKEKSFGLFLAKPMFSWKYSTFKQFRKTFKKSLKSIFKK